MFTKVLAVMRLRRDSIAQQRVLSGRPSAADGSRLASRVGAERSARTPTAVRRHRLGVVRQGIQRWCVQRSFRRALALEVTAA